MDLYIRRETVLASKYKQGLEDGFSIVPKASLDDTFKVRLKCDNEDYVLIPYISIPGLGNTLIHGDEFIVSEDEGITKYVMGEEDFCRKFTKAIR